MFFELTHKDKRTKARTGIIHTDHGDIETPIFMPVGTQATVKTLDSNDLENLNAQIILGNTYHLHLRPGEKLVKKAGGLHKFMNWNKPILTDSGGFQVFSLGLQKRQQNNNLPIFQSSNLENERLKDCKTNRLVTIDEEGVTFQSHIDGSTHRFTPEESIRIQYDLGADIIMAFDECTPDNVEEKYVKEAMDRTHRWAERSLEAHKHLSTLAQNAVRKISSPYEGEARRGFGQPKTYNLKAKTYSQYLFGIIQGSNNKELRQESAKFISSLDFDGIAVGGESVGYNMEATKKILDWVYPYLPENKPHYAMGLGLNPSDLFEVVERGIDMFDCVAPTRQARHGLLYIFDKKNKHKLDIRKSKYKNDFRPIDPICTCPVCSGQQSSSIPPLKKGGRGVVGNNGYTRAYLHHLFKAEEMTAMRLATIHNIHFFLDLMRQIREAIKKDKFLQLKKKWC